MKSNAKIRIRCHHLLCLPGYKGMGYNHAHSINWDRISRKLSKFPETRIIPVEGQDSLCIDCPNKGGGRMICNDSLLKILDKKVSQLLGLEYGKEYSYKEIAKSLREKLTPKKHMEFCGDCFWRRHGLCNDTFKK